MIFVLDLRARHRNMTASTTANTAMPMLDRTDDIWRKFALLVEIAKAYPEESWQTHADRLDRIMAPAVVATTPDTIPVAVTKRLKPLLKNPLLKNFRGPHQESIFTSIPISVFLGRFQHAVEAALGSVDIAHHARYAVPTLHKLLPTEMKTTLLSLQPSSWEDLRVKVFADAQKYLHAHEGVDEIINYFCNWPVPAVHNRTNSLHWVLGVLLVDVKYAAGPVYRTAARSALNQIQHAFGRSHCLVRNFNIQVDDIYGPLEVDQLFMVPQPMKDNSKLVSFLETQMRQVRD